MNALTNRCLSIPVISLAFVVAAHLSTLGDEELQPLKRERLSAIPSTPPAKGETLKIPAPDGKFFASLHPAGLIKYCSADGLVLRTFHQCSPITVIFSPDGRLLCSVGTCPHGFGAIKIWRLADGRLLAKLNNELDEIPRIVFSPDGSLLACTVGKARVNLWELPEGTMRWSTSLNRGISSLEFDEAGVAIIARCADKSSKRLSLVDGELISGSRKENSHQCCHIDDADASLQPGI